MELGSTTTTYNEEEEKLAEEEEEEKEKGCIGPTKTLPKVGGTPSTNTKYCYNTKTDFSSIYTFTCVFLYPLNL